MIQPYQPSDLEAIVQLSLRAWTPVFVAIQATLSPMLYHTFYPEGWETSQEQAIRATCQSEDIQTWVISKEDHIVGFISIRLNVGDNLGEIYMIAVDPIHQGQGIGSRLTDFAVEKIQEAGITVVMVDTGGDPGHAPARATYEKAGFEALPIMRYFKRL